MSLPAPSGAPVPIDLHRAEFPAAAPEPEASVLPGAFAALYDRHRDEIWRFARRRGAGEDRAEDVVAEVFTVAWRRWDAVPDPALPWLYGVARRQLANDRRAAGRRAAVTDVLTAAAPLHAADLADGVAERDALLAALAALQPADREVLMLAGWEGLSPEEIATVLDCRAGTARVRLHRARKRLHQLYDLNAANPRSTR